jgi:hypothetical protein
MYAVTEEYNGTSWTAGGNLTTATQNNAGAGTQTAGLSFGGINPGPVVVATTEEYNGTSWAAGGSLTTARRFLAGAGTQPAGLAIGGSTTDAGSPTNATEEYTSAGTAITKTVTGI